MSPHGRSGISTGAGGTPVIDERSWPTWCRTGEHLVHWGGTKSTKLRVSLAERAVLAPPGVVPAQAASSGALVNLHLHGNTVSA